MRDVCIVVADGSRARFYQLQWPEQPELVSGPDLLERTTLAAPEHAARDQTIYTEGLTGRNRTVGSGSHDYDEHRDDHDDVVERRFAKEITRELARHQQDECIVCAAPRMMGFLRDALAKASLPLITEVPRDLTHFATRDLQVWLASEGLIPERKPPTG